jgi:acid phosphatase
MRNRKRVGALGAFLLACVVAAGLAAAGVGAPSKAGRSLAAAGCQLGDKGHIKHVIYIQFDNTHFLRDNANVPSDLEQMPHLLNFIKDNGTLLTNDHTVLISHTATGILSSLTGVYPDRMGIPVSNSFRYFTPAGTSRTGVSFAYWTSPLFDPAGPPFPPAAQTDLTPEMINEHGKIAPAPWVPYARAGCDVGAVATANTILENTGIDVPTVFGAGSPEAAEVAANPQQAFADFVGIGVHCAAGSSICSAAHNGRADVLPDEPRGYTGFNALYGAASVDPVIKPSGPMTDLDGHVIQDATGHVGFPGFDGMEATVSLSWVLQMQKAGVPVTYAYVSDAHDGHGTSGNIHFAYGPGEDGYREQLQAYDDAFGKFFTRLADNGINKSNTLFVFTVDEGDHFVGDQPTPAGCTGSVANPCNYTHVGEINGDLRRMVRTQFGDTTNFSVHSDDAPNVYVNGNPGRTDAGVRTLEREMSQLSWLNPYSGKVENGIFQAMADPVEEKALHMVTADPFRTPTFTPFADPDWFFFATGGLNCATPVECATIPARTNQSFAWNHGDIQSDIATTWAGYVGPGVKKSDKPDGDPWTDHTDLRPTILTLLGLKDDYETDGRAVTELMKGDAIPKSLDKGKFEELAKVYKQIDASFGQFAMDTLTASTKGLASFTPGDKVYTDTENAITKLTNDRNDLVAEIRTAINDAEFNDKKIDEKDAKDWIKRGNDLLDAASALAASFQSTPSKDQQEQLKKIDHVVVIYEENHSFDNLYGGWEGVNGLSSPDVTAHMTQIAEDGTTYKCLKQDDANLTSPPLATDKCSVAGGDAFDSHFANAPFSIDDFIHPADITCPPVLKAFSFGNGLRNPGIDPATNTTVPGATAGGCTRDIVHRFYHEQYQLDGGKQDRYVTGSDAIGLTMGTYDTKGLPVYKYLHSKDHPDYAIDDNFFQGAFGGSFLNHQWLIAAASPLDPSGAPGGANETRHPVLDANGMPSNEPLYTSTLTPPIPPDRELTATCAQVATLAPPLNGLACGNYGVNTMQPPYRPFGAFGAQIPAQTNTTIGDELTAKSIDWAWYAGGWANADGDTNDPGYTNGSSASSTTTGCSDPNVDPSNRLIGGVMVPTSAWPRCPDNLFQYHHQPFNYFANYAPGTAGRAHLQDEKDFTNLAQSSDNKDCNLKAVSFVKPFGDENEHPGYTNEPRGDGDSHLVTLLKMIESSACAKDTMVVVTYDEFGGQWDHVPPPGQGNTNGPFDVWGPGTRVPTLIIAPHLKHDFVVDSTEHDTTSILATIEHRWGLHALGSRDALVNDLSTVFAAKKP